MKINKKKAFTLTELLVVVVVMGILSAAVLPKFTKVMETRKTTEAEGIMAAIRTEQERRCALDKGYTNISNLADVAKTSNSKNFTYTMMGSTGMQAKSQKKHYVLKMMSYADGGICCDGDGVGNDCDNLNKEYPSCSTYTPKPSPEDCAVEYEDVPIIACTGSAATEGPVSCNTCGTTTRTQYCDASTGTWEWEDWTTCTVTDASTCETPGPTPDPIITKECSGEPGTQTEKCGTCGKKTKTQECNTATGEWYWPDTWGDCKESTKPSGSPSQPCNTCGTQTRELTCTKDGNWQWGGWSSCSKEASECNPGPTITVNPQATTFVVFSEDNAAYLAKDSALCGCNCSRQAIRGTRIIMSCANYDAAVSVCSRGGVVGCVTGSVTPPSKQHITIPGETKCIGKVHCVYTSSLGTLGGWEEWGDECHCTGQLCSADNTDIDNKTCNGTVANQWVSSDCKPGCTPRTSGCYHCGSGYGSQTCDVPAATTVSGYVCDSSYLGSYSCPSSYGGYGGYGGSCGGYGGY